MAYRNEAATLMAIDEDNVFRANPQDESGGKTVEDETLANLPPRPSPGVIQKPQRGSSQGQAPNAGKESLNGGLVLEPIPSRRKKLAKQCLAFLFSHIGLTMLVFGYTILGAYVFQGIEVSSAYKRQKMPKKMPKKKCQKKKCQKMFLKNVKKMPKEYSKNVLKCFKKMFEMSKNAKEVSLYDQSSTRSYIL